MDELRQLLAHINKETKPHFCAGFGVRPSDIHIHAELFADGSGSINALVYGSPKGPKDASPIEVEMGMWGKEGEAGDLKDFIEEAEGHDFYEEKLVPSNLRRF